MIPKQRKILSHFRGHATMSLKEATHLVAADVYANKRKHTGAILANMIKRGMLVRVARGTYTTPERLATLLHGSKTMRLTVTMSPHSPKAWVANANGEGGEFDRREVAARIDNPRALEAYYLRNF